MYAVSAEVKGIADKSSEPDDVSNSVEKVIGKDKVSVSTDGDETTIEINLKVKNGIGLSSKGFDAIVADIKTHWNTSAEIGGHTYRVKTWLTVDDNILSSGDFSIEECSSLPPKNAGICGLIPSVKRYTFIEI